MRYDITRGVEVIANIQPEGKENIQMMGAETVSMTFSLPVKVDFEINDECIVYGRTYFVATEPSVEKKSSREFAYNLQFVGIKYKLADVQFFTVDSTNALTIPEFTVTTNAETLVDLLISNANRFQTGWTKGVVDETEHKQVDFSDENCLTALNKIAEAFDLEFWVDGNKSIHFTKRNEPSGYTFRYGKGNGLRGITRTPLQDSNVVTRLYATGSEQNLPNNYRNGQKKLRMSVPYLEKNISIYGVKEHIEKFEDIRPERIGTVTAVDAANPLIFSDSDIDFDLNATDNVGNTTVLIKGLPAKVIFQTGQVAGYTFEIREYGYNTATKSFTLLTNQDEKATELPNTLMRPQVGDKYILVDIQMPSNYVADAEAKLQVEAQKYLDENSVQRLQYTVISDPIYFKTNNINVTVGFTNRMIDVEFGLDADIRVTSTVKDLQNRYDVQFEMADTASLPGIIKTAISNQNQLSQIIKNTKFNTELARLSYYFAREMFDKVFDGEGYFDAQNIKPLSIETKSISLGSPMQAFAMPNVSFYVESNLVTVSHTSGELVHFGLIANATRSWFLTESVISGLSAKFNYIYIKAEKQGTVATVIISEAQILVDSDPNFYYFEAGVLSSVNDGYRQIKMTHGFGMINPAEISIGRISSPFGGSYIEILQDKIKIHADVEFTDDSIAFEQINGQIFIGGENLLQKSGDKLDYYDLIDNRERYYNQELPYCFSVDALSTQQTTALFVIVGKNSETNEYEVIKETEISLKGVTERISISFKTYLNHYKKIFSQLVKISDNSIIETIKPKLEIGNRPTDYNASQYDVNTKISEIEQKNNWLKTSIYGNIVATGTVLLGNYETGVNAGITGEGGLNDVFLWSGSDFSNRNTATTRFYRNGKFYATDAYLSGEINANSGRIGGVNGWQITASDIRSEKGNIVFQSAEKTNNYSDVLVAMGASVNNYFAPNSPYSVNFIAFNGKKHSTPSAGANYGAMVSATNAYFNVALELNASGGGGANIALLIGDGGISVGDKSGITKTFQNGNVIFEYTKGICTAITVFG